MKEKQKRVLVACCIGIVLCMLDTSVMNIALPSIQNSLNVNISQLSWSLNVYTIMFASLTIPLSRFADYIGKERLYIISLFLFLFASLLCGISQSIETLILGRVFQGISASMVFPLSMIIGISTVNLEKRTSVIALLGVSQGFAAAIGPTIGGIVTQYLGWHYVFLINIPLVVIALLLCFSKFKFNEKINLKNILEIDYLGSILAMGFMFSMTIALVNINDWGWNSLKVLSLVVIGIILAVCFIINEKKHINPIVPIGIFRNKQFFATTIVVILSNIFLIGIMVTLPSMLTNIKGYTELQAALLITPISIMIFIFSPISAMLVKKIGPKIIIGVGFVAMSFGYLILANQTFTSLSLFVIACLIIGFGYGVIIGPATILAAADFTGEMLTASQSIVGVVRQIGLIIGVALFVAMLTNNIEEAKVLSLNSANEIIDSSNISVSSKEDIKQDLKLIITENEGENIQGNTMMMDDQEEIINASKLLISDINEHMIAAFVSIYKVFVPVIFVSALSILFFPKFKR